MNAKVAEKISVEILIAVLCIIPIAVLVIFNLPGMGAIAAILAAGFLYARAKKANRLPTPSEEHDPGHKSAA
jgi:hypothetical protein